jgi:two-component system, OmpR family, phosphate regulon sensor histidine kinase PhoR
MTPSLRILIYSSTESTELVDASSLISAGYDVVAVTQPQAVDSWLRTFLADSLLIVADPSFDSGLRYSAQLLEGYPYLSIILISTDISLSNLKQALEIGLFDCLSIPLDPTNLLRSVQRNLARQKYLQDWFRLTRVLENLEDGVILANNDGHLLMINRSARNIFSLEDTPLEGKSVNEVLPHPDLLDLFKTQNSFPRRSEISFGDKQVFSAQASLIPEIGIAIVLQEITHLKELDRRKTDFVNTVSHDLRSPLTAIYGFIGLIDRVGPINEQQAEFIHHIQSSVQNITSLINDLMELDRLEAGYDIHMVDVNLIETINKSIEMLDYQLNEKMQELVQTIPADVPAIIGNPLQLQRMITNLIENAIKFTPPLGKISVHVRGEGSQLILQVSDNGPGIPLEDQPHVFEKFYRASNLSQTTSGTGLGLSIVQSIVEKHHGRIWLESSPSGTTFTVILPIK